MNTKNFEETFRDYLKFFNKWLEAKPFGCAYQESACYILKNSGKMIRPKLVLSVANDLNIQSLDIFWMALSVELHHTYTLIHDDLPCMDNDDIRRGKPSVHVTYGESHALLLGDIFLSSSLSVLSNLKNIDGPSFKSLIKVYTYLTGQKGLIFGQHMDLCAGVYHSRTSDILRLFELKTSRLFQLSLLLPVFLSNAKNKLQLGKSLFRLGEICGLIFQILDDKEDFKTDKRSDFNFFRFNFEEATKQLKFCEEKYVRCKNDFGTEFPSTFELFDSALKLLPR